MSLSPYRPCPTLLFLAVALGLSDAAHAAPQATTLDAVNVTAASEAEHARATLKRVPGASNVVDLTKADGRLSTSADVLAYQPGISAQSPGNEGAKVSIRGSGINRGPGAHASGVAVSLDGLPLSGPGGTPYELLEPLWLSRAEVLRGANGFERGALALGGAINYVSRSGRDSAGLELQYEAGSRGYQKRSVGYGGVSGDVDYYLAYTDTESDGYQRHAASDGKGAMANLGWQITPTLETRFFVRYRETNHETPGRLTRDQIRNDPRAANPANLAIDARRPQPGSTWIGNMTTWQIDEASSLQAGLVYHKYPMDLNESLYRQQLDYSNLNATVDYRHRHLLLGRTSVTTLGLRVTHDLDADVRETLRFASNGYAAGTHTRDFSHHGTDSTLHIGNDLALTDALHLQTGLALINTRRDVQVTWPATPERLREHQWDYAPRLGFTWQQTPQTQWFGNLSRSVEPAHPWSMIWGSNQYFAAGNGASTGRQRAPVQLDNQTATTLELGARGDSVLGRWELTGYYARVLHELLTVEVVPVPNLFVAENNASPTVHRGLEAGLDSTLWQGRDGRLSLRQAYTFSDFRYRDDALFGSNRLPGLPRHYYQAELRYDHPTGFYAALNTEYASAMFVDYANSVRADSHAIVGSRVGFDAPSGRWQAWAEMRNIGDRHYAATVTPGYNDAGKDVARSTPGEGRGVYAGLRWRFD
ncbi:TonB-dependent receptor family protein [Stenotrophomonas rhizophila]|uniref:TonB-dependent receptor family protein n=1 Tax=Stenotrophomonas rhizophila TaxID=216778 RepID=UPI000456B486|nr:TonB-dependent receptor [Stenotrophomonas rhizophila]AHY58600.1 TonB-dependent receptor [Stenotrophomonas rhizophila]